MPIELIKNPTIFQEGPSSNSPSVQKDQLPEEGYGAIGTGAVQAWLANSFVKRTSTGTNVPAGTGFNRLARVATGDVVCYGQSPDAAKGSTTAAALLTPPFALFGLFHYCFDPRDRIFEVNIGTATDANLGTNVGVTYNGGGTGGVQLAAGQKYGIRVVAAGIYTGFQILDVANTATLFFEVVGIAPDKLPDNNSSRILAKVIPTILQG